MNAEFQWWLLILGIVIGGALVYLVLADVQGDPEPDDLGPSDDAGALADAPTGDTGADRSTDDEVAVTDATVDP